MEFASILPALGGTAWTLIFFIIALSVIVAIHEYGHYIVGRWCGIHAEVFSVGFGKVLYSKVDKHGTKWQVAALPFGGYVKFLGDANAASVGGTGQVSAAEKRRTMLGAPLWARSATVAAGPIFNFILAIFIFAGYQIWNGEVTEPLTYGSSPELPAEFISELEGGDQILGVDGYDMEALGPLLQNAELVTSARTLDYRVLRDGSEVVVQGPHPRLPLISAVVPRSAADDAGIRVGDVIMQINDEDIFKFNDIVEAKDENLNAPLKLTIARDGSLFEATMTPRRADQPLPDGGFETIYLIGLYGGLYFEPEAKSIGIGEAFWRGTQETWWRITTSLSGFWHLITGAISSCNLSGPVGIAQTAGSMAEQGTESFFLLIGILSVAVGLLNLFPIPILDGGHLVFHAYEAVTRRKPSDGALRVLMSIGLALIGALMVFGLLNDILLCP